MPNVRTILAGVGMGLAATVGVGSAGGPPPVGADEAPPAPTVQIGVEVPSDGGLAIGIAASGLQLGPAELDPDGDRWHAAGELPAVTVVDLRAADPGWTVTGSAGDDGDVAGSGLSWTPLVLATSPGQDVAAGATTGAGGLGSGAVLATATAGAGRGTATLGADLRLALPADVPAGTYRTTLSLTVI